MANEDNNIPSLEDMVFFEDDLGDDFSDLETGKDPTGDDSNIDNVDDEPETPNDDNNDSEDIDDDDSSVDADDEDLDLGEGDDDSDDPEGEDSSEDNNSSESQYSEYFNFLKDNNLLILGDDFEFDGTAEGFEKAVQKSQENIGLYGAQMIWDKLPDDFKLVLEYGLAGGNDINAVKEVINNQTDLSQLNIEDEATQAQVMSEYFKKTTKYDDKKIGRMVDRLKKTGDLEEEAESALEELKGIYKDEKESLKAEAAKAKAQEEKKLQESYTRFTETVNSIQGLNKTKKEKIINSIWATGKYGEFENTSYFNYVDYMIKSNPEHLAQLAELYLDYDPKKGFNSESVIKKAESKVKKSFRDSLDKLNSTKTSRKGGTTKKTKKTSDVDQLEAFLNQNN